jgi:hypothetical protein
MAKLPPQRRAPAKPQTKTCIRVFGNKPFMRFARKFGATEKALWEAHHEGPDADLGGGVFKFRLAREGEGERGGARSVVAMKEGERIVMMFGFEKKDQANINAKELKEFKKLAAVYLKLSEEEVSGLLRDGKLTEIKAPQTSGDPD